MAAVGNENSHPEAEVHVYYNYLSGYDRPGEDREVHAYGTAYEKQWIRRDESKTAKNSHSMATGTLPKIMCCDIQNGEIHLFYTPRPMPLLTASEAGTRFSIKFRSPSTTMR